MVVVTNAYSGPFTVDVAAAAAITLPPSSRQCQRAASAQRHHSAMSTKSSGEFINIQ